MPDDDEYLLEERKARPYPPCECVTGSRPEWSNRWRLAFVACGRPDGTACVDGECCQCAWSNGETCPCVTPGGMR